MNDESNQLSEEWKLFAFFCNRQAKSQIVAKIIELCFVNCSCKSKISRFRKKSIDCVNCSSTTASNRLKFEKLINEKHQHHFSTVSECQTTFQHTISIVVSLIWKKHSKFKFFIIETIIFHEFITIRSVNHRHFNQQSAEASKARLFKCAIDDFVSKSIYESNSINSNTFRCTKHTIRKKFKFIISNWLKFETNTVQTKHQRFVQFIWNRAEMAIKKWKISNKTSRISINASKYSTKNHIISEYSIFHYIESTVI